VGDGEATHNFVLIVCVVFFDSIASIPPDWQWLYLLFITVKETDLN